jgi:hypothetical protein
MATVQERRLGYHSQAGLEPGTSRFSTLLLNHYAARIQAIRDIQSPDSTEAGMNLSLCFEFRTMLKRIPSSGERQARRQLNLRIHQIRPVRMAS